MKSALAKEKIASNARVEDNLRDHNVVEEFLAKVRFFRTPIQVAVRILRLNEQLGDNLIETELNALSPGELISAEDETFEMKENWFDTIIERVSSALFHQGKLTTDHTTLSEEEVISFFQKTISERIYDRLSLLALSPHARKRESFSLTEELTEGIAEDIGLGLCRQPETPTDLREEAQAALLDLAREFQRWLMEERRGVYTAPWGEVRATGTEAEAYKEDSHAIVWLEPDVECGIIEKQLAFESAVARV